MPCTVGADSISARGSMRQRKPRGGVKTAWRRTASAASQQSWPAHAVVCPAGANIVRSPISLRSTVGPRSQPRTSAGRRGRRPLQRQYGNFSTTANGRGGLRAGRPTSSRLRNLQGKIPPFRAVSQYHKQKGRADDPSSARPFVFIPIYACRNRLRNSTVFAFCGCSKMSAGVPSSQMTPSAM